MSYLSAMVISMALVACLSIVSSQSPNEDPIPEKLGYCRHVVRGRTRTKRCHPDLCQVDTDCPDIKLCCFDGCAKACTRPQLVKTGICPINLGRRRGRDCEHDFDCFGSQKCCQIDHRCESTCRKVCVSPVKYPWLPWNGRAIP